MAYREDIRKNIFSESKLTQSFVSRDRNRHSATFHISYFSRSSVLCPEKFLQFLSGWDRTRVEQNRSRYTLPGSPRHAAVTALRFVETSVSGKRDWTAEGNVQEIKLARRVRTKTRPAHLVTVAAIVIIVIVSIIVLAIIFFFLFIPVTHLFRWYLAFLCRSWCEKNLHDG